jgi:hypothetical protein
MRVLALVLLLTVPHRYANLRRVAFIAVDSFNRIVNAVHCLVTDESKELYLLLFERLHPHVDVHVPRITHSDHDNAFVACAADPAFALLFPFHRLYLCTKHGGDNAKEHLTRRKACMSMDSAHALAYGIRYCMLYAETEAEVWFVDFACAPC